MVIMGTCNILAQIHWNAVQCALVTPAVEAAQPPALDQLARPAAGQTWRVV